MKKNDTVNDFEMKLVYYIGDEIVKEEDVTADNIEEAVTEVAVQDYDDLGMDIDKDEDGACIDCFIGIKNEDKGWLVWQNSDGERGFDFDVNELNIDPRIKQAVNTMY